MNKFEHQNFNKMGISIEPAPLPLEEDQGGIFRVGGTRVTLDAVLHAFKKGATTEEIALQFPSLDLSDVYAVISFYLKNKEAVDVYLLVNEKAAKDLEKEIQQKFPVAGIRERLLQKRQIP